MLHATFPHWTTRWNDMDGLDTDNSWNFFMSKVNYCIEKHVPVKRANVKFKKPKWMDQYCVRKVKKKYHAWKRFTFSHSYVDYENYCKLRNSASKAVRFAKKRYQRGIAESVKISPKTFWSHVKEETKSKSNIGDIKDQHGNINMGTESWLDGSIKSSEVFPSNFKAYRRDRNTGTQGGGVFLLVSEQYQSNEPEELKAENCEVVWSKIKIKGVQDLYVGAFYKPPSATDPDYLDNLSSCLSKIPRGAHLWLGGDFNLADIDWENECTVPQAANATQCSQLLSVVKDAFLDQIVSTPTRITEYTSNILDLFLTNNRTLVNKCEVVPGIGDHEAVYVESSMRPMKVKTPPRKVFQYKKANYDQMQEDLREYQTLFTEQTRSSSVNDTWIQFEEKLKELTDKHIPSKMISGNRIRKPWMDKTVRSGHRKVKKLFAKQKKSGRQKDRRRYLHTKAQAQRQERQAYWKYVENLIELGDNEQDQHPSKQKRFFSFIKSLKKDSSGVAPLRDQGKLHSDPVDKANILNRQYQSQFTDEDKSEIPQPEGDPSPTMPDIHVTTEGVLKLLQKLNVNKASGPDMIPARLLKELSKEIAPFLCIIYQKCLETGTIPDVWRTANVSAIYKKGEKFKASNYRPVSLTCISCKKFEHIIVSNIMRHLDTNNILTDCQHGFRPRRSCETQLITLVDELVKSLNKGKQHDLAILDFSKAFDRVPHERLLRKLDHHGIRGKTLDWIRAFLTDRTQKVAVEGVASEPIHVKSGVPQGSVLGPILFLVFINDLPASIRSSSRLFADDCVVYREIRSDNDCQILQDDLQKLWDWEKKWGMSFHPEKCSILRVHRKRAPVIFNYSLKGHTLTCDESTKYLGVEISQDMSWKLHIDKTVKKGNSTLGFLRRNLRINSEDVKSAAYISLVRPNLEYCSTIWNPYHKDQIHKLEMVQRRAARYATNRYHNTSSVSEMLDHLNWETLESRRTKAQLTMMFRIVNSLVDVPLEQYLTPASSRTRSAHSHKFRQISTTTSYYKNSFFPRTIITWNSLSPAIAEAPDLVSFKQGLSTLKF